MKAIWRGQVIAESDRILDVGGYRYFPTFGILHTTSCDSEFLIHTGLQFREGLLTTGTQPKGYVACRHHEGVNPRPARLALPEDSFCPMNC